jgi:hypothetical protein
LRSRKSSNLLVLPSRKVVTLANGISIDAATAASDVNGADREDLVLSDLSYVVEVKPVHVKVLTIVDKPLAHSVVPNERPLYAAPPTNITMSSVV